MVLKKHCQSENFSLAVVSVSVKLVGNFSCLNQESRKSLQAYRILNAFLVKRNP